MPRSKNPNPRQVTDGENKIATENTGVEGAYASDENNVADTEGKHNDILTSTEENPPSFQECENQQDIPSENSPWGEALASLNTGNLPPMNDKNDNLETAEETFIPIDNISDVSNDKLQHADKQTMSFQNVGEKFHNLPTLTGLSSFSASLGRLVPQAGVKKPKSRSPGMLNPMIMTWMRNRYQLRPGGRISAKDIIELYKSDTKDLYDPPPELQNYQVGQLLRRLFPNICRAKITVNGKRLWIYRHLNLRENPPADLFEEQNYDFELESEGAGSYGMGQLINENSRASDSPMSNFDDENSPSPVSMEDENQGVDSENKEKSNAILLGLLGNGIKTEAHSPTSLEKEEFFKSNEKKEQSYLEMGHRNVPAVDDSLYPKKKRDSEVMNWLQENYKFKPGYYVKSMDLLKEYNHARDDMVKYLSQVGRVMKHVFPAVRHLRKSFKGGKREWIYLNLKPIDVDSDSEEGKKMLMPTLRRSATHFRSATLDNTTRNHVSHWSRERGVNISHTPISLVQNRNALLKSKDSLYHSVSRMDGSKLIISRSPAAHSNNSNHNVATDVNYEMDFKRMSNVGNRETSGVPVEIERDIFAPFTKLGQHSDDLRLLKSFNINSKNIINGELQPNISSSDIVFSQSNTSKALCSFTNSGSKIIRPMKSQRTEDDCWASKRLRLCATLEPRQPENADANSNGLDLSMKRNATSSDETSIEPSNSSQIKSEISDPLITAPGILNLTKSSDEQPKSQSVQLKTPTSQTLHYKPESGMITLKIQKSPQGKTVIIDNNGRRHSADSIKKPLIFPKPDSSNPSVVKKTYVEMGGNSNDVPISWSSLQNFSSQRYGWLRSPTVSCSGRKSNDNEGSKSSRYVEWFLFSGQWLVNGQRALREIKIYEDWTVVIHALGRRVYPNDLGGITDLEKTSSSLNKVFRVLAEAKMCMGFPAPSISDLYIHGILVSKFEVWSSRENPGEDIRQRAVNCQILYSGGGACCAKCTRIMKLHQQQRRGTATQSRKSDNSVPMNMHA